MRQSSKNLLELLVLSRKYSQVKAALDYASSITVKEIADYLRIRADNSRLTEAIAHYICI